MDAVQMILLFDYYGGLLAERQRMCFDLRYNQDLSLGEIAAELGISRQGVYDNITRAEQRLLLMEEQTGCVRRLLQSRKANRSIRESAQQLLNHPDPAVRELAARIDSAAGSIEE